MKISSLLYLASMLVLSVMVKAQSGYDQFMRCIYYRNGTVSLLPFSGENDFLVIAMQVTKKDLSDTTLYWKLEINDLAVSEIKTMPQKQYFLRNDTLFVREEHLCDSAFVLRDSSLCEVRNPNYGSKRNFSWQRQDDLKTRMKNQIKDHLVSNSVLRDILKNGGDISEVYAISEGKALVVFSYAGEQGMNQQLFLFDADGGTFKEINFQKPVFRFYDLHGNQVVAQFDVGGIYFKAVLNLGKGTVENLSELRNIKGDMKTLRFASDSVLIGLDREPGMNGPSPIKKYSLKR